MVPRRRDSDQPKAKQNRQSRRFSVLESLSLMRRIVAEAMDREFAE